MRLRKGRQGGFTLIELLMVVAIIGVLAAIAVPMYTHYRVRAFNAAANADLRNFKTQMESAHGDLGQYPQL